MATGGKKTATKKGASKATTATKARARKAVPAKRRVEKHDAPLTPEQIRAALGPAPSRTVLTEEIGYEGGAAPGVVPAAPRSVQQAMRSISGREMRSLLESHRRAAEASDTREVIVQVEEVVEPPPAPPAKPPILETLDRIFQVVEVDGKKEIRRVRPAQSTAAVPSGLPPFQTWLAEEADRVFEVTVPLVESLEPLKEDVDVEQAEAARLAVLTLLETLHTGLLMRNPVRVHVDRTFRSLIDPRRADFGTGAIARLGVTFGLRRDYSINDDEDRHLVNYQTIKREVRRLWESWKDYTSGRGDFLSTGKSELRRALARCGDAVVVLEAVLTDRGIGPELWDDVEWGGPASDPLDRVYLEDGLNLIHSELAQAERRLELDAEGMRRVLEPGLRFLVAVAEKPIVNNLAQASWHVQQAKDTLRDHLREAHAIVLEFTEVDEPVAPKRGGRGPTRGPGRVPSGRPGRRRMLWEVDGRTVYVYVDANGRPITDEHGNVVVIPADELDEGEWEDVTDPTEPDDFEDHDDIEDSDDDDTDDTDDDETDSDEDVTEPEDADDTDLGEEDVTEPEGPGDDEDERPNE